MCSKLLQRSRLFQRSRPFQNSKQARRKPTNTNDAIIHLILVTS